MGTPRILDNVILISAICAIDKNKLIQTLRQMTTAFGAVRYHSDMFQFNHTTYYSKEMGPDLVKQFFAFEHPIDPTRLVDIKLYTNEIEDQSRKPTGRSVNIDPAYMELPKLVVATTKNFSHRIYLGKGIYGDVQLYWRGGKFAGNPWTFPDYKQPSILNFFTLVRNHLAKGE